jgi:hypothetical protein
VDWTQLARVFVPDGPLQFSVTFVSKARAYSMKRLG